jgi:hypothetical protein
MHARVPGFDPNHPKYTAADGPFRGSRLVKGIRLDPCCGTVAVHLPRIFDDVPIASDDPTAGTASGSPPAARVGLNESGVDASLAPHVTSYVQRAIHGGRTSRRSGRAEARFTGLALLPDSHMTFSPSESSMAFADASAHLSESSPRPHGWGTLEAVLYNAAGLAVATHVIRCGDWREGLCDGPATERLTRLDPATGAVLSVEFREGVFQRGQRVKGFDAPSAILPHRAAGGTEGRHQPSPPPRSRPQTPRGSPPRTPYGAALQLHHALHPAPPLDSHDEPQLARDEACGELTAASILGPPSASHHHHNPDGLARQRSKAQAVSCGPTISQLRAPRRT